MGVSFHSYDEMIQKLCYVLALRFLGSNNEKTFLLTFIWYKCYTSFIKFVKFNSITIFIKFNLIYIS